jgi:hypothetical protein
MQNAASARGLAVGLHERSGFVFADLLPVYAEQRLPGHRPQN